MYTLVQAYSYIFANIYSCASMYIYIYVLMKSPFNFFNFIHTTPATDMRRIWSNAMMYNVPGSKVYTTAKSLSEVW